MSRPLSYTLALVAGLVPGLLMAGPLGGGVGAVVGLMLGIAADRLGVRPGVGVAVIAGTVTGAFIGSSIARVLCLPATCRGVEAAAWLLTGVGAFVGVGMIAALTTRSFDEHRAAVDREQPPPTTGCESGK